MRCKRHTKLLMPTLAEKNPMLSLPPYFKRSSECQIFLSSLYMKLLFPFICYLFWKENDQKWKFGNTRRFFFCVLENGLSHLFRTVKHLYTPCSKQSVLSHVISINTKQFSQYLCRARICTQSFQINKILDINIFLFKNKCIVTVSSYEMMEHYTIIQRTTRPPMVKHHRKI